MIKTSAKAADFDEENETEFSSAWERIGVATAIAKQSDIPDGFGYDVESTENFLKQLSSIESKLSAQEEQLEKDVKKFDRAAIVEEGIQLSAREWASQQKKSIKAEVERLKQVAQLEVYKKKTNTQGISRKAGQVSEALITEAYVSRFNAELKALGASYIQVELVKKGATKGEVKHRIVLTGLVETGVAPADILSEGENRIVALAGFLADVTSPGRGEIGPFVFDDPISSLDQSFEEKTVERLVELSKERQVIVFTHRLSLLSLLSAAAPKEILCMRLRRLQWGAGQPSEFSISEASPKKALNRLKNDRLSAARKAASEGKHTQYESDIKAICTDLRNLVENSIELVLLSSVIRRHRRKLVTQNKLSELSKINPEDCALLEEMMTKYSCFAHSQSDESPVGLPSDNDLLADLDVMISWVDEFSSRAIPA